MNSACSPSVHRHFSCQFFDNFHCRLELAFCSGLTGLEGECLRSLGDLVELDLQWCDRLPHLPPTISGLTALTTLNLAGCEALAELPPELSALTGESYLDWVQHCCAGDCYSVDPQRLGFRHNHCWFKIRPDLIWSPVAVAGNMTRSSCQRSEQALLPCISLRSLPHAEAQPLNTTSVLQV